MPTINKWKRYLLLKIENLWRIINDLSIHQKLIGQTIHINDRYLARYGTSCTFYVYNYVHFRLLPDFRVVEVFYLVIPRCNMKVNSFPTRAIFYDVHVEYIYVLPHSKSFYNNRFVSVIFTCICRLTLISVRIIIILYIIILFFFNSKS